MSADLSFDAYVHRILINTLIEDGRLSADDGGNEISGSYLVSGSAIVIDDLVETELPCRQDTPLSQRLGAARSFGIVPDEVDPDLDILTLYDFRGDVLVILSRPR